MRKHLVSTMICQVSSWAVMEVIVWNKVLDAGNMTEASNYLLSKLAAGVNEEGDLQGGQGDMLLEIDQRFLKCFFPSIAQ